MKDQRPMKSQYTCETVELGWSTSQTETKTNYEATLIL